MDAAPSSASGGTRSSRKGASMDFGVTLQTEPAGQPGRRTGQEGRGSRLHVRLDLRLAHPLAGALRHPLADALRDGEDHGRSLRHQPRQPRPLRNGVDLRHPQRHVRQPHYLRHRARRLRTCGSWAESRPRSAARRGHARHQRSWPKAREVDYSGAKVRIPWVRTASSTCGWPATVRRRSAHRAQGRRLHPAARGPRDPGVDHAATSTTPRQKRAATRRT